MTIDRLLLLALSAALLLCGCGGDEMSLTEYVERTNAVIDRATRQYEVLVASDEGAVLVANGAELAEFEPHDLKVGLERVGEIETEVQAATDAIEAPAAVADLHEMLFDARFTTARENLAARAGSAAEWKELTESPEMNAYRTAVAGDLQVCSDFQAELDATAEQGAFADASWIPGELQEVVDAILGCTSWPDNPEDLYRLPPDSTS